MGLWPLGGAPWLVGVACWRAGLSGLLEEAHGLSEFGRVSNLSERPVACWRGP